MFWLANFEIKKILNKTDSVCEYVYGTNKNSRVLGRN